MRNAPGKETEREKHLFIFSTALTMAFSLLLRWRILRSGHSYLANGSSRSCHASQRPLWTSFDLQPRLPSRMQPRRQEEEQHAQHLEQHLEQADDQHKEQETFL